MFSTDCRRGLPLLASPPRQVGGEIVIDSDVSTLRDLWEATGFQLERLQANPGELKGLEGRVATAAHACPRLHSLLFVCLLTSP